MVLLSTKRKKSIENFWNGISLDEDSNVQFGEGGAGTFSDGKLTCGVNDIRMDYIKEEFVRFVTEWREKLLRE